MGPSGDDAAFALLQPRIDVGMPGGDGPVWSRTFASRLHGYVLRYPSTWDVSPALTARAEDVFRYTGSKTRLSITVRSKPPRRPLAQYADALVPHHVKDGGCHWSSPGIIWIPAGPERFDPVKIAGRDAVIRTECDFIEAVVDLGDHALVVTFRSAMRVRVGGPERPMFDLFMNALDVTEPAT